MGNDNHRAKPEDESRQKELRDKRPDETPGRQIDDNQDDLGRDVNDPDKTSNEINKQ